MEQEPESRSWDCGAGAGSLEPFEISRPITLADSTSNVCTRHFEMSMAFMKTEQNVIIFTNDVNEVPLSPEL